MSGSIREDLFVEIATNPAHPHHKKLVQDAQNTIFLINYKGMHDVGATSWFKRPLEERYVDWFDFTVNREAAIKALDKALEIAKEKGCWYSKGLRPYMYEDLSKSLDTTQPWWGWEFETGYHSTEERADVIQKAWDVSELGVTFDSEGEGEYYSEITFAPVEMTRCLDGSAPAFKLMEYINTNGLGANGGASYIGTHFNFSLPEFRGDGYDNASKCAGVLNNTMHMLPGERSYLFGRTEIYAGAIDQGDYIECKIFRTTYNLEVFKRYMRVARAFTRISQAVVRNETGTSEIYHTYCTNLVEMVEDPTVEPHFEQNNNLYGSEDGSYVSGNEGNEYYDDDDGIW